MKFVFAFCLCIATVIGCRDDANGNREIDNGCPDLGGNWEIVQHCESSYVGDTVKITQTGCDNTYAEPFTGWIGSADEDDNVLTAAVRHYPARAMWSAA